MKRSMRYPRQYNALPTDVQERVIENLRDINVDYNDWYLFQDENYKEDAREEGWTELEFEWSGFYSQSDYCHLVNADIDINKFMRTNIKELISDGFDIMLIRDILSAECSSGYVRKNAVIVEIAGAEDWEEDGDEPKIIEMQRLQDKMESWIDEEKKDRERDYFSRLRDEFESQTSKEAIENTIECNDYLFDEDGHISRRIKKAA